MMRHWLCCLALILLAGCSSVPSCTVGVALVGPLPVPLASCEVTFYSEDEDDELDL
jgi:hypothetical protein